MRPEALREATRQAAAKTAAARRRGRLAPGEKPNRKRMATVACVFETHPSSWTVRITRPTSRKAV